MKIKGENAMDVTIKEWQMQKVLWLYLQVKLENADNLYKAVVQRDSDVYIF